MKRFIWLIAALSVATYSAAESPQWNRVLAIQPKITATPSATTKARVLLAYTSAQGAVYRIAETDSVLELGGVNTTAADGARRLNVRNTVSRTYTPVEGDLDTDADGKLWIYTSGQWVENGAATPAPIPMSGLSDWPEGVTATNVGHLAGTTGNIQQQFAALSAQVADLMAAMEAGGIDITPEPFTFTDQTSVALNTTVTSAPITVAGINTPTAISVSGGSYDINASGNFVTTEGTVSLNDTVRARHTSSASNSEATNTTVTIGGISDTFTSTTAPVQSCTEVFASATPTTDSVGIKTDANRVYQGMIITGSTTSSVCSITVRVHGMGGTRTAYNYRAYLYSRTGTALNLDSGLKATSNAVVGSTMTTGNEVTFTFPTPIVPATGDVFVFSHDQAVSSANYILLSRGTADTDSGFAQQASYLADGTQYTTAASYELYYKLVR